MVFLYILQSVGNWNDWLQWLDGKHYNSLRVRVAYDRCEFSPDIIIIQMNE